LILKFTCPSMSSSWGRLFLLFSQLNPFSCRIVVIHGYLTSEEMKSLVSVTDYFVNASKAEGQCLPLLEFMAEGVPAIAPDHTAMSSYIDESNAFVVQSSLVATCWPQDPREYDKTFFYRIDWSSLHDCYLASAKIDALAYRNMSFNAASLVRKQFSASAVEKLLANYLHPFSG
jgi:glycosyltransferase involved in cell wall biosynthesis